ncbi:MAG: LysR family transcriptional regulator [Clostridia bacterium]|nr:LysR family transcriptional regulator [Clostridia bacterium]
MNILHLKYAIEIAKSGSINKASEILRMGQPNLSRAIKELESSVGITIFERSARGMIVTPEGEEFLNHARNILRQIDEIKSLYNPLQRKIQRFSISVPRSDYINRAFARFSCMLGPEAADVVFRETDAYETVRSVVQGECQLGVIRYASDDEYYFKALLDERRFCCTPIFEFTFRLTFSKNSPLCSLDTVKREDLEGLIEIERIMNNLSDNVQTKKTVSYWGNRKIKTVGRTVRFELLSENLETFAFLAPISRETLERYGLVQKAFPGEAKVYKDVLIYRSEYTLSPLDKVFISELLNAHNDRL